MAEQKTKPTGESVSTFIAGIEDERRRRDAKALVKLMGAVTGEKPKLWNGGIVGFGSYHYKYDTGHQGEACLAGFAPRKSAFSIYLMGTYFPGQEGQREALLKRLGKHSMGKACLYVKRLEDIDLEVLEELTRMSVTALREAYPLA